MDKNDKKKQTATAPEQYPDTYVFKSIKHKRLSLEQEAEARKQAHEYLQKEYPGLLGPELKPPEKLELDATPSLSELTELAKQRKRISDLRAFPLPDIYDADDPRLPRDAFSAIKEYRLFLSDVRYMSELARYMKEQLCAATDVALDIRSAFPELREVPVAKNPDRPTKEDFINLEQWFLDAYTFEQAEIERESRKYRESTAEAAKAKRKADNAPNGKKTERKYSAANKLSTALGLWAKANPDKRPTIDYIAKQAGVSHKTATYDVIFRANLDLFYPPKPKKGAKYQWDDNRPDLSSTDPDPKD